MNHRQLERRHRRIEELLSKTKKRRVLAQQQSLPQGPASMLRALGFCGADDSVHPNMLAMISRSYPFVEFGVLFRPDKEGQPRYASAAWVEQLKDVAALQQQLIQEGLAQPPTSLPMKLAAHFCESRVDEILKGDDSFLSTLKGTFQRVQINATAVNGVDMSALEDNNISKTITKFLEVINRNPEFEFIVQKNEETKPLWNGLLKLLENKDSSSSFPTNVSMLVDESKGTGVVSSNPWPKPPDNYRIGYAGGMGPHNIETILKDIMEVVGKPEEEEGKTPSTTSVWVDMESKLRSTKNDKDVFDLDKCYQVIDVVCALGLHTHPDYLLTKDDDEQASSSDKQDSSSSKKRKEMDS